MLIRAGVDSVTLEQANKRLGSTRNKLTRLGHFVYPVCLFYFAMREDQAFFSWLAEPVSDSSKAPKLLLHKTADCKVLTDQLLNDAVTRIVDWYDALQTVLVAQDGAADS